MRSLSSKGSFVRADRIHYDAAVRDVVAGFDIGGTKVALVLADSDGRQLRRSVEPTDTSAPSIDVAPDRATYRGLSTQLVRMLQDALSASRGARLRAIGVVSAGPIREGGLWNPPNIVPTGDARSAPCLPWYIPVVPPLREVFACPVDLLNDCSGAVLGEVFDGLGKDVEDKSTLYLAYATISTGFGVGAWDGGRLVLGKEGNAGELGHIVARVDGLPCGCGNRGCVEAYASGAGIVRNARARVMSLDVDARRRSSLAAYVARPPTAQSRSTPEAEPRDDVTPAVVFDAAERGDPIARAVIADGVFAAGVALSAIANAYDPQAISVGGGIALAHPEILDGIRAEMLKHLNVCAPEVCLTPLGAAVTERGAIAVARRAAQRRRRPPVPKNSA